MSTNVNTITAFECSICHCLEKNEEKIFKHYQKCLKEKNKKEKETKILAERENNKLIICREASNIDEVKTLLEKYAKEFFDIDLKITTWDFRYEHCCSNSHSAPRGKEKNWCGTKDKEDIPKGYPGFTGTINGSIVFPKKEYNWGEPSFSDLVGNGFDRMMENGWFGLLGIHTESGGGGNNSFSYGATIWIDDFPKIKAKYEKYIKVEDNKRRYDHNKSIIRSKHQEIVIGAIKNDEQLLVINKEKEKLTNEINKLNQEYKKRIEQINKDAEPIWKQMVDALKSEYKYDEKEYQEFDGPKPY